ncbi:DUF305 domain-containing protein [Marinitenerispora sediminis]|uniref:DUF305 domain-containing protein n=1 Tax=Marinitenerispora sediminis TaxID=1931232 RepID=A0A368T152_9ACTN|nr:DUF305 domain-containing protein [Marinitenerispora sediminis]RCV50440.1 DUF305 domain-containing protein [Marinitenerispora sediminis]RCV53724.1 DUF305 domain-containing protein [Marinitenerispora sediminis]RCV53874.1 DUF305 domain-containing protein [Marinitenerispora sediminis]
MGRWLVAAGTAVLLAGVAGCAQSESDSAGGPPVLAPGAPGESASPATEDQLASATASVQHNEADVEYVLKMIEHHGQALEMTDLVPDRVEDGDLELIADRIAAAQGPEIDVMESWLETNVYGPARENPAHQNYCGLQEQESHHGGDCVPIDHEDMPGMATEEQLAELEAAEGAEFDELFVELMTTHHEGAVSMAEEVLSDGENVLVSQMATDVVAEQRTEIERMRRIMEG